MARVDADFLKKFFVDETPTGSVDGLNTDFTLANSPFDAVDAVQVFVNGIKYDQGTDWTISGSTISFAVAPSLGQNIRVNYIMKDGEN